jgi:hypothetical protein
MRMRTLRRIRRRRMRRGAEDSRHKPREERKTKHV